MVCNLNTEQIFNLSSGRGCGVVVAVVAGVVVAVVVVVVAVWMGLRACLPNSHKVKHQRKRKLKGEGSSTMFNKKEVVPMYFCSAPTSCG